MIFFVINFFCICMFFSDGKLYCNLCNYNISVKVKGIKEICKQADIYKIVQSKYGKQQSVMFIFIKTVRKLKYLTFF